jgi:O-antigen/teichoic acid export membrane protein
VSIVDQILKRFNLSGNRNKAIKNILWAIIGKLTNILSGLFVGILVARYLGPENFGLMNYVISYVTLFSILASFGLDNIEIRELAKGVVNKDQILGTAFNIRLFFASITILFIILTLYLFESDVFTSIMVLIYSSSLLLSSFNVIRNYFISIVLNEYIVKTEISRTLIGAIIKIVLLLLNLPLYWFIIATAFDFLLVAGGYLYSYQKKIGLISSWQFNKDVARILILESFPLLLSGAALIIYQKIDQVMIRNMMDNTSLGQFSVASKLTELIIFFPSIIAQTLTPFLIEAHKSSEVEYKFKSKQFMDFVIWGTIFVAFFISVTAKWIVLLLYGDAYIAAIPVLQIMAWKAVGIALSSASGQLIIIEGLQRYAIIRNLLGCVICVSLNLLLIPNWGIIGSAWATIITVFVSGYLSNYCISPFKHIFKIQSISIYKGWKSLMIKSI